jgi:hypothetical protein
MEIQFFHRKLPVLGDAPVIEFDDGAYKVWELWSNPPNEWVRQPMREKVGAVTLQERFDYFVWKEAALVGSGRSILYAHHFRPADKDMINYWLSGHKKRAVNG